LHIDDIIALSKFNSAVAFVYYVLSIGVSICIIIFLYKNNLNKEGQIYSVSIVLSVVATISRYIYMGALDARQVLIIPNIVRFVVNLACGLLVIAAIRGLNNRIQQNHIEEEPVLI
jgi:hypothetical protein